MNDLQTKIEERIEHLKKRINFRNFDKTICDLCDEEIFFLEKIKSDYVKKEDVKAEFDNELKQFKKEMKDEQTEGFEDYVDPEKVCWYENYEAMFKRIINNLELPKGNS